jgi:hypothetical protein
MAEAFQHRGNDSAEIRRGHGAQGFEPGDNRVRQAGDFLLSQLVSGGGQLEREGGLRVGHCQLVCQ